MPVEQTPVLIVGGGPVGLALRIDLSWRGIRHILVDRDARAARADHPRMDQVGIRSTEHLRRLGIAAEIEAAGFPRDMRRDVVFGTGVLGFELAREPFEADAARPAPPFSPQKHEFCPQNFLDPALQSVAERASDLDIRYHTRLTNLRNEANDVRCELLEIERAYLRHRRQLHRPVRRQRRRGCPPFRANRLPDDAASLLARVRGAGPSRPDAAAPVHRAAAAT